MAFAAIPQSYVQKCKILAHIIQALFTFIAGCITIAVFTNDGFIGGGVRWYFALCFITAPALVYLVMVPMWPRTVRFANVYAFLVLDAVYAILWLSAFISVAMYNADGIRQGAADADPPRNEDDGDCSTFAYGSERKCSLSRATVGLGVVVFVGFLLSAAISAYWAFHYRKTGETPFHGMGAGAPNGRTQVPDYEAPKLQDGAEADNAWSADMHERRESDEYGLLHTHTHDAETEDGRHPGRPLNWGSVDEGDTRYHGAIAHDNPSALSPGGFTDYRRSDVPSSGYNATIEDERDQGYNGYEKYRDEQQRQGSGYSFSGGDNVRQI